MPNGKVVHISDEMHKLIRTYCDQKKVSMRFWVEQVLTSELQGHPHDSIAPAQAPPDTCPAMTRVVVKKRSAPKDHEPNYDDTPAWALPPFWSRG